MELNTYYICLLRKGPKWTSEETPELEELHAWHTPAGGVLPPPMAGGEAEAGHSS
ncbi:MAG TPA: hypothetical protein VF510_07445 [Ktedonobacterales bacterium]